MGTPAEKPAETPAGTPGGTSPTTGTIPDEAQAEIHRQDVEAQAPPRVADLRVTASFDRATYPVDADIAIRVTVENVGPVAATDVRLRDTTNLSLKSGELDLRRVPGPVIGPGERRTYDLVARQDHVSPVNPEEVYFQVSAGQGAQQWPNADPTPNDNSARITARVPREFGSVDAVVFVDANGNGQVDAGEGQGGLSFVADGGSSTKRVGGATSPTGTVRFTNVTAGHYRLTIGSSSSISKVPAPGSGEFDVVGGRTTTVLVPLVEPVSSVLVPRVEFLNDPFVNAGDQVQVRVTLKNSGSAPLTGVVAVCNQNSSTPGLTGTGPGWAALHPDGPGVTLAAGETKQLVVTDVVPQAAADYGSLYVGCDFGNDGRNTAGYRGASDFADVNGKYGKVTGTLLLDDGAAERPLAGTRVVALDQRTGLWAAETTTDDKGAWRFDRVVAGPTRFVVPGEFKPREGAELVADVVAGRTAAVTFRLVPGPRWDVPAHSPKVEVTASFDKDAYDVRDVVTARIRIANNGTGGPERIFYAEDREATTLEYERGQWGVLGGSYSSPGMDLWPGQVHEVTITGTIRQWSTGGAVRLKGWLGYPFPGQPASRAFDLSAKVVFRTGDADVLVYGDANGNGSFDQGEGLPGIGLYFQGGLPNRTSEGRTDDAGRFRLKDAPAGVHEAQVRTEGTGWARPSDYYGQFTVEPGQAPQVELRLVRPLSDVLHAAIEFDKESYDQHERVGVKITLTNDGPELPVRMHCGGELPAPDMGPEWGPFAPGGTGVVLKAGETREFQVVTTIPDYAADHGLLSLTCGFGPGNSWGDGHPEANDLAKVTGVTTTVNAEVLTGDYPFTRVPDVTVVLVDLFSGKPVARSVADGAGTITFPDLKTGLYKPVVVGPWKLSESQQNLIRAVRGDDRSQTILVEPGPEVADPWTDQPGAPGAPGDAGDPGVLGDPGAAGGPDQPGAGQPRAFGVAGKDGGLADTGASVIGLGLLGGLALVLGFVVVVASRRRTA
ncbi:collagen-like triple helix repeat-containing protein [Saccharothrix australiensis]|uniref:collagen-like triple helix repeat-containing protein n=1 Tax=Saccharothrix australiensis TaxID=2072 RepID=UPI0014776028|nr:collagen-like protein [Saccharothrix australiensis]